MVYPFHQKKLWLLRTQLDVNNFEQASPLPNFENAGRCSKGDPVEGLLRMPSVESSPASAAAVEKDNTVRGENFANPTSVPSVESSAAENCMFEKDNTNDISSITTGEAGDENFGNPTVPFVESSAAGVEKDNIDCTSSIATIEENSANPTSALSVESSAAESYTIEKDSTNGFSSITTGEDSANPTSMPSVEFSAAENCTVEKDCRDDISLIYTGDVRDENSANPLHMFRL